MNWTWYPDLKKYFTGYFTEKNYYGRPGIFLTIIAVTGIISYLFHRVWLSRVNLIMAGLGMGYAIKSYLLFISSYDGYIPEKQPGIFIMLISSLVNMVAAMVSMEPTGKPEKSPED